MSHVVFRSDTHAFSAPISGAEYNPAAHGNVKITEHCRCGAVRHCNINGRHEEQGPWDMPHERPNVAACAATVEDCRQYLEMAAGSRRGREILTDLCGLESAEAIIHAPRRGDVESTLHIARLVHARMQ
jgi:hypothetical protein